MDWVNFLLLYLGFIGIGVAIENDTQLRSSTPQLKKPNGSKFLVQGSVQYTSSSTAITKTECGTFQGAIEKAYKGKVEVYKGIQFAEPPTGELRYKYPVPYKGYNPKTTYQVTEFCPPCIQPVSEDDPGMSREDCLCLNIYKPVKCSKKNPRPVLIYFYESYFLQGSTSASTLNATNLAAYGDMVVVVPAYRLGALGLLTGGGKEIPGNAAFWDAVLAATWVNKYIDSFGGDTSKITISGHGAGATFVLMFLETPFCADLFTSAMIFSPFTNVADILDSGDLAYRKSKQLSTLVGCAAVGDNPYAFNKPEIQCLKTISAEIIAQQSRNIEVLDGNGFCAINVQLFPNQGINAVYLGAEYQLFQGKFLKKKSVLFGAVPTELKKSIVGATASTKTEGAILLTETIASVISTRKSTNLKKILELYLDSIDEKSSQYAFTVGKRATLALNDLCIHCPYYEMIISLARLNKVFIYYYTYVASPDKTDPFHIYGAFHEDDQRMAFGIPFAMYDQYNENDRAVSCEVMQIWSDFVHQRKMKWPRSKVGKGSALYVAFIEGDAKRNHFERGTYYEKVCPRLDA